MKIRNSKIFIAILSFLLIAPYLIFAQITPSETNQSSTALPPPPEEVEQLPEEGELSVLPPLIKSQTIQRIETIEKSIKTLQKAGIVIIAFLILSLLFNLYIFLRIRKSQKT